MMPIREVLNNRAARRSLHPFMRTTIKQITSIARLTALEASRQPIFLLLTTAVLLFIGLLPLLITHVISDSARMVRDSALAVQWVSGLVLGCYAASSTITRELRRGTLASILSKPVGRGLFFLSKFAGVSLIMLLFAITSTLATMLSVRTAAQPYLYDAWGIGPLFAAIALAYGWAAIQHYFLRIPFVSRTYMILSIAVALAFIASCLVPVEGEPGGFGAAIPWNIAPAGLLLGLAMVLISSFAVSLATRLDTVPTLSWCVGLFLLGLMSDYLFGRRADEHWFFDGLYGIIPNWQHFWAVDALHRGAIPWSYTLDVVGYVAVYAVAVLCAGLLSFMRMEVK